MVTNSEQQVKVESIKTAFGNRAFSGNEVADLLGVNVYGTGGIFKYMMARNLIRKVRSGTYQFVSAEAVPTIIAQPEPQAQSVPQPQACDKRASVVKIGPLYIPETVDWLADTLDTGRITLHTAILEIDPNTKHARNKRIVFRKDSEPREYAQLVAWLDSLAGNPPQIDDTALELAADLERQLNAARKEIADLKARIKKVQVAFSEATI